MMEKRYYFILTALPELPQLGQPAPLGLAEFRELIIEEGPESVLVDAVLLEEDLTMREAVLSGEIDHAEGIVLTDEQVMGREDLPDFLRTEPDRHYRIAADATWWNYYNYVNDLAQSHHNAFLRNWVGFEVNLRNALVEARAAKLNLQASDFIVAQDIGEDQDVSEIISAWSTAPTPIKAMQVLDQHRRKWLDDNVAYYNFGIDEILAYARTLILVARWYRLEEKSKNQSAESKSL